MFWNVFRRGVRTSWLLVVILMMGITITRADGYRDNRALGRRLMSLAEQNPDAVRVTDMARSLGKRKVWLVEVGKGTVEYR